MSTCDQVQHKSFLLSLWNVGRMRDLWQGCSKRMHVRTYAKARQLALLTDGRFKGKGCSWILYSLKHLLLRFLGWKPFFFFSWKSMLYKHRGIISAVERVSDHFFKIYKGSEALAKGTFCLKWYSIFNSGSSGTHYFLFFWKLHPSVNVYRKSLFPFKKCPVLILKDKKIRSLCAVCPAFTLFPT